MYSVTFYKDNDWYSRNIIRAVSWCIDENIDWWLANSNEKYIELVFKNKGDYTKFLLSWNEHC